VEQWLTETRSRFFVLPWQQNFWILINRVPANMAEKTKKLTCLSFVCMIALRYPVHRRCFIFLFVLFEILVPWKRGVTLPQSPRFSGVNDDFLLSEHDEKRRNEKRPTTFLRRLTVTDGQILTYAGVFWFVPHSYVGKNCCLPTIISG